MIKWMLVYIVITNGEPIAVNGMGPKHLFDTLTQCFWAREVLLNNVNNGAKNLDSIYFPPNTQGICMKVKNDV